MAIVFLRITGPVTAVSGCWSSEAYYDDPKKLVGSPISSPSIVGQIAGYLHQVGQVERRTDAVVGHRLVLALPSEADDLGRREFIQAFSGTCLASQDFVWRAFVHRPPKNSPLNHHAHLICSDRPRLTAGQLSGHRPIGRKNRDLFRLGWLHRTRETIGQMLHDRGYSITERSVPGRHIGPAYRRGSPGYVGRMTAQNEETCSDPLPGIPLPLAESVIRLIPRSRRRRARAWWTHRGNLPPDVEQALQKLGGAGSDEDLLRAIVMACAGPAAGREAAELLATDGREAPDAHWEAPQRLWVRER